MAQPFDAVLVVAFGGPLGPDDVRPFLANVLRGRRVPPERVEEVAHHYDRFGGVSPLHDLTMRQAAGLESGLAARGIALPVYVGMRNWHPFLGDTLARMSRDGVRRALGFLAAAHRSYSGCTQYRENVADARAALRASGLGDVEVTFTGDWHTDPGFVAANAAHVRQALAALPRDLRGQARIVFTAHSIPVSMAERYPYAAQLGETAAAVAADLAASGDVPSTSEATALVYQSRSGRPEDPWLGPDVCDYLRQEASRGLKAVVLSPVGFVCDHIEVLYDLDVEAMEVCRAAGVAMARAQSANDDPRFIGTMVDVVARAVERYRAGRPLPIVPGA